jgi:ABC-type sugar transport system ATPase subunit
LTRKTAHLSGGEMQRVSIGRAIVRDPRVFLMDEPLSNLDAKLREALRVELKHLQKTRASTTLFVTHDQIEALTMADRIAVLRGGRIIQIGTPHDIYDRPATTFVAQLVGSPRINLLDAGRDDGAIHVAGSPIRIPVGSRPGDLPRAFTLGVRPEDITPRADGPFAGTVALIEPLGVETLVHIKAGDQTLVSTVPGMARLERGGPVRFDIARERLHFFGHGGERVSMQ